MSKGYQGKFHRHNILSRFAKDLVRRSHSKCELCNASGVKLEVYELPPGEEEPNLDDCLFICEMCRGQVDKPKTMKPAHWRCLNNALWSEIPAVQVISVRILRRLAKDEQFWAKELLENAFLDPDIEEWADSAE